VWGMRSRVLVAIEPASFRIGIEIALASDDVTLMPQTLVRTLEQVPSRRMLLHPSARPDVLVTTPQLASELAPMRFTIVAIDPASDAPLVAYADGAETARVPASLAALVDLVRSLLGPHGRTAAR
jgi:hypothetical protein